MIFVFAHKQFDDSILKDKGYQVIWINPNKPCPSVDYDWDKNYQDNIADKNNHYSELSGIYHIWKNHQDNEIIGLCQYRYYFSKRKRLLFLLDYKNPKNIISVSELSKELDGYDIILPPFQFLPRKVHHFFFRFMTIREHYAKSHYESDLDKAKIIISRLTPDYLIDFEKTLNKKTTYFRNMFVTRREVFNEYCSWLFPLLFEIEKETDFSIGYDGTYQERLIGYLAERLFNVWLYHNKDKYRIKSLPIFCSEKLSFLGTMINLVQNWTGLWRIK